MRQLEQMPYEKRVKLASLVTVVTLAGILLLVPASMGITGNSSAYAQGYGSNNGQGNGNGNGQNGNNANAGNGNSNATSNNHGNSNNNNSTNANSNNGSDSNSANGNQGASNGQGKGPGDNVSGHGHNASERMQDYVNETAQERHQEHLSMNAPITGPYSANLNYTVSTTGNATAISDSSNIKNATITLDLSIWKSTPGVVSMDILNGTLKIGDNQTQIYSGHAYYLTNKPRLIVYGFIVDNGMGSQGNSSSLGHTVSLVKLFMSANGTLPAKSSDPALQVTVLSPQSKVASEWFLDMEGQVKAT